jgi:hypothetical protein
MHEYYSTLSVAASGLPDPAWHLSPDQVRDLSSEEVKALRKRLARRYHPQGGSRPDAETMTQINQACDAILDFLRLDPAERLRVRQADEAKSRARQADAARAARAQPAADARAAGDAFRAQAGAAGSHDATSGSGAGGTATRPPGSTGSSQRAGAKSGAGGVRTAPPSTPRTTARPRASRPGFQPTRPSAVPAYRSAGRVAGVTIAVFTALNVFVVAFADLMGAYEPAAALGLTTWAAALPIAWLLAESNDWLYRRGAMGGLVVFWLLVLGPILAVVAVNGIINLNGDSESRGVQGGSPSSGSAPSGPAATDAPEAQPEPADSGSAGAPEGEPIVGGSDGFVRVAADGDRACAITSDQHVECWSARGPARAPAGRFIDVAMGETRSCGITTARRVRCWGSTSRRKPSGDARVVDISVALDDTYCAVTAPGGSIDCEDAGPEWINPTQGGYQAIAAFTSTPSALAGSYSAYVCALRKNSRIDCWATDDGESVSFRAPRKGYATFASDEIGGCARPRNGGLECWADSTGVGLSSRDPFTDVSIGVGARGVHGCAILAEDRRLACFGLVLTDDAFEEDAPAAVTPAGEFVDISSGIGYACGVRFGGDLECFGNVPWDATALPGNG